MGNVCEDCEYGKGSDRCDSNDVGCGSDVDGDGDEEIDGVGDSDGSVRDGDSGGLFCTELIHLKRR